MLLVALYWWRNQDTQSLNGDCTGEEGRVKAVCSQCPH